MPYYNYKCMDCEDVTEVKASWQQKEEGLEVTCPNCQSTNTTHEFGNVAAMVAGNGSADYAPPSGGGCPGGACGLF